MEEVAKGNGWKINDDVVFIRGQEELIKPKRILAKIDFESEAIVCLFTFQCFFVGVSNIISSTR